MSDRSSRASGDSTSGSNAQDTASFPSAKPTSGAEECSPTTGPVSHAGPTCEPSTRSGSPPSTPRAYVKAQKAHDPEDCERWEEASHSPTLAAAGHGPRTATVIVAPRTPSTSSAEASPARTSLSRASAQGSPESAPDSSTSSPESPGLFDQSSYSSRTYPASSLATVVGTSEASLPRWPTSGTAWHGGFSTADTAECLSDGGGCLSWESALTEILEEPQNVPERYSLSERAASGILRRAQRRGRRLPEHLERALRAVAERTTSTGTEPT